MEYRMEGIAHTLERGVRRNDRLFTANKGTQDA